MLRADKSKVPAVRVTLPVKVVAAVLSSSVKFPVPLIVVRPVTEKVPELLISRVPADTLSAPATEMLPVVLSVSPPEPLTVNAPRKPRGEDPVKVVPPFPLKVKPPVPVIEILSVDQEIGEVAVIVLAVADAKVILGTLSVPAV